MADRPPPQPPSTAPQQPPQQYAPPGAPPPYAGAQGPSGPRANFGQRLVAALVDGIILAIVQFIFQQILGNAAGVFNFAVGLAYFIYLEGSPSGQTIGKKILNIRVVDFSSGGPIGYGQAAIRYFARILSAIACLIGYLWMLWDKERQTWHDKLSNSVVVPTSAYPVADWPG